MNGCFFFALLLTVAMSLLGSGHGRPGHLAEARGVTRTVALAQSNRVAALAPAEMETGGTMAYVTKLIDGRLLTVYGDRRPVEKWNDVSILQRVFGRLST